MKYFKLTHISAGFVAMLIGYTSAGALIYQAAQAAGGDLDQMASWMWAVGVGMGVFGIGLSIYYKQPLMVTWSTPGAALLVTSLSGVATSDAIGAFIFCSVLIVVCALSGWVDRILKYIPPSLATAMLAGVLLRFGLNIFPSFLEDGLVVGAMIGIYILGRVFGSLYTVPMAFACGLLMVIANGQFDDLTLNWTLTTPVFVMPSFDLTVMVGVGIPLFIVTMASQNLPGIAVLRAHHYNAPASPLIGWTGVAGLILAPFGGYAFNMGAITAAICMGKDVDPDPAQRYRAVIWCSLFYIFAGLFGGTLVALFKAFPGAVIAAIAGLALLGTIANSMKAALENEKEREAAILCLVITAGGGEFLGVSAPFWGIVTGVVVSALMKVKEAQGRQQKTA